MSAESATDRASFFNTDDFGVTATYDGATSVNGVFTNEDGGALPAIVGGSEVATTIPRFICQASDVDTDPRGKSLVVSSVTYEVVDAHPDGTGIVILDLEEQ